LVLQRGGVLMHHMERDARVLLHELRDGSWQQARGDKLGACDANLSNSRIGQELDLLDALTQLVEDSARASDQDIRIGRCADALGMPVQQSSTHGPLKTGNRLEDRRLRHRQMRRCLGHAPAPHYLSQTMKS